jgi:hypothetical protein
VVDLHTASFGRINSYYVRADLNDPDANALASLLKPQIILHDAGHGGTLRGAATKLGIKAITVEIGNPQLLQVRLCCSSTSFSTRMAVALTRVCAGEIRINSFSGRRRAFSMCSIISTCIHGLWKRCGFSPRELLSV